MRKILIMEFASVRSVFKYTLYIYEDVLCVVVQIQRHHFHDVFFFSRCCKHITFIVKHGYQRMCGSIHNTNTRCIVGALYTVKREMKFILIYAMNVKRVGAVGWGWKCKKDDTFAQNVWKRKQNQIEHWARDIINYAKVPTFISLSKQKSKIFPNVSENEKVKKNTKPFRDRLKAKKKTWEKCMYCLKRWLHCFIFNSYRKGNFQIGGFKFSDLILCSSFGRSIVRGM